MGNLFEELLTRRSPTQKKVILVADLSSSNKIRDENLLKKFEVTYAGCSSHARRPFYRYAEHDSDTCIDILDDFTYLFSVERLFKSEAPQTLLEARQDEKIGSAYAWNEIKSFCEDLKSKFSDQTPLGRAARYVTRNFEALTIYLDDVRLPASNNMTERLVRFDKLTERNTYGHKTIEGRGCLDVRRTLLVTCQLTGLDEQKYLMKIMITPEEEITKHPEK